MATLLRCFVSSVRGTFEHCVEFGFFAKHTWLKLRFRRVFGFIYFTAIVLLVPDCSSQGLFESE